ncbi:MAG: D-glycero-beta-D-manno-heptose-7-phosphate kinase [Leptospiraceae bacterium]|nr:D-glycero-beta-D-manno-heptose-7-phosphate kinase [Leptospiraceae bacterium]MCP5512138.1 D-glycero-beta-D-manno-heptose-7-phosphate kinase [Leptospiraceae bacterium]
MKIDRSRFTTALGKLSRTHILVVGDLILDEYLVGEVTRISPEAPVPVVLVKETNRTLGGAGNVVRNLRSLGVQVTLSARIGNDQNGEICESILAEEGIPEDNRFLLKDPSVPTIVKTRIIASHQQVCRVDREVIEKLSESEEVQVLSQIQSKIESIDGIILSDYDKGFLSKSLIHSLIQLAKQKNITISADPQVSHFFSYHGISIMTPNHHEAGKALNRKLLTDKDIESASKEIAGSLGAESMMITRGEKGMSIYTVSDDQLYHIPTVAREVFDVTGAGDTVITIYTLFKAAGLTELESAIIANAGAGIVVERLGASTVTADELIKSMEMMGIFK